MRDRKTAPPRGWRQWDETEARAALAEFATSGVALAEFARRKGVSATRLRYWRARLATTSPTEAVRFVPVATPRAAPVGRGHFEVTVRGVVLRATGDVAPTALAQVVAALVTALPPC